MTRRDYAFRLQYRDALRAALLRLTENPTASTTLSTGDGTKSVTWQDRVKLQDELRRVEDEINDYKRSIKCGSGIELNYPRFC